MIIDHEELMAWAKEQAPNDPSQPVRLEISAEEIPGRYIDKPYSSWTEIWATVYLRDEPGGTIAERRLA